MGNKLTMWQAILGPFPEGTIARFRDGRFRRGYVEGEIIGYFLYYVYDNMRKMKPNTFSYKVKLGKQAWNLCYKRPSTVIKVLNGQKRKKE